MGVLFGKILFRIKNTDIPYYRGYENVCNEVFNCGCSRSVIGFNGWLILGCHRFFIALRRSFLIE
jgi:hypothetical protein